MCGECLGLKNEKQKKEVAFVKKEELTMRNKESCCA